MSDQCQNCILKGDLKACESEPCTIHESWYVSVLQQRNAELEAFVTSITDIYGAIQDDCIMEIVKSAQSLTSKEGE